MLENNFEALEAQSDNIEDKWDEIKNVFTGVSDEKAEGKEKSNKWRRRAKISSRRVKCKAQRS